MHTNEQIDPALFRDSERTAHDRIASSYQAFCVPITANAAMQLLDAVRASVGMRLPDVATGRGVIAADAARPRARVTGIVSRMRLRDEAFSPTDHRHARVQPSADFGWAVCSGLVGRS